MSTLRQLLAPVLFAATLVVTPASAQSPTKMPLDQGFEVRLPAFPSGEERSRQPDLWMLDVDLKPMRMRYLEVTDPANGEVRREQVWYLVYRVYNRPIRGSQSSADVAAVNELDTPYTRPMFQPQLTLITYDNPADEIPVQTIPGDVLPEVVNQLRRIEERRAGVRIHNAVDIIQPLPAPAEDVEPIYGIAVFRDIDPDTDFFKVTFKGFTNAYELRDDEKGARIWRKSFTQKFQRRGDRFDPNQAEFEFDGEPVWMYVPAEEVTNPDIIAASNDFRRETPEE